MALALAIALVAVTVLWWRQMRQLQHMHDAQVNAEYNWKIEHARLLTRLELEQTMMDSLEDPLLLLDNQRHVIRANRCAFDLLGAKLLQQDIAVLLRDKSLRDAIDIVLRGEPTEEIEYVWNGPVVRTYEISVTPFRRFCDGPFGSKREYTDNTEEMVADPDWPSVMVLMTEITTIKRAEETRIDFIANISHELRTPLASLLGFIETIRGAAKDDKEATDRFLGIMQDQAQRMSRLVSDLLSLSRVEVQEHQLPIERVNLIWLLGNLWATMELRAAEKGININMEAPRELPEIYGDRDQLIQAFTNLVENAIKYGPENSDITINASVQHDGVGPNGKAHEVVAISVADQGEGIPKENLEKLTGRFYRTESAKARRIPGTGLGLAIVKHIVNRHRGRLNITSEPGRGTTFTVLLPVAEEDDALPTA